MANDVDLAYAAVERAGTLPRGFLRGSDAQRVLANYQRVMRAIFLPPIGMNPNRRPRALYGRQLATRSGYSRGRGTSGADAPLRVSANKRTASGGFQTFAAALDGSQATGGAPIPLGTCPADQRGQ